MAGSLARVAEGFRPLSSDEDDTMTGAEVMASWDWCRKVNVVFDHFRRHGWGPGMSLKDVRLLLRREWRSEFGTEIPDESLSGFAPSLAGGRYPPVRAEPSLPCSGPHPGNTVAATLGSVSCLTKVGHRGDSATPRTILTAS